MREIHADQENGSKLNMNRKDGSLGKQTFQTTLGCMKEPADSQRRWDRERQCSRRTPGPLSASHSRSKSPKSPRRCSSEGEGEADKEKRRLRRGR